MPCSSKKIIADGVRRKSRFFKMLRPVKFDDQLFFRTVKINYIRSYRPLFIKMSVLQTKKLIPKFSFFFGHVASKPSCIV